jgi:predicted nuclease of predicted toxin-antitoxin system
VSKRPTFYVDYCLGKAVAEALRAAGAIVEIHSDNFAQDVEDTTWIPRVAAKGWVILTKDKNIRRRHGERETTLLAQARMFTLSSGNMRGSVMAELFVKNLDAMETLALALEPPFLAVVSQDGIELVYPRLPDASGGEDGR